MQSGGRREMVNPIFFQYERAVAIEAKGAQRGSQRYLTVLSVTFSLSIGVVDIRLFYTYA